MPEQPRRRRPANDATSDIERFLAEVDRLRKKAAEPKRGDDVRPMDEVQEVLPAEPAKPPLVRRAPPPRPQTRPRPRPVDQVEVVDVAPPQPAAPSFSPTYTPSPQAALPAAPALVQSVKGIAGITGVTGVAEAGALGSRAANPTAARMLGLLRSNNLRAAILLHEVLKPPLSKRRRR